ncbi:MAG: AAA family ATPase [bacterium]
MLQKINTFIERFNRTLSEEFLVYHRALMRDDSTAFNEKLIDYLLWYNTEPPHASLDYLSPLRYYVSTLPIQDCHMLWTSTINCEGEFFSLQSIRHMARIISICNAKGGVGKTTTAVNMGAFLSVAGRSVLLVDFDPQGNATSALSNAAKFKRNIYHGIIGGTHHDELIRSTALLNYEFIPSSQELAGALIELVELPEREYYLRKFLNRIRHRYDYILIDLPPSLSLLTLNGLIASDEVLIPVQAEYYGLEGLSQLLETITLINDNLRHPLKVSGAVITLYDKRERLSRDVAKNLREHFPHRVFDVEIPRNVALAEAPSFGKTILTYSPKSAGALAYRRLANEVIKMEEHYKPQEQHKKFGNFNVVVPHASNGEDEPPQDDEKNIIMNNDAR